MTSPVTNPQAHRGERLGLPSSGPGSLSTAGPRLGAFVVDAVASSLVAALFVQSSGGKGVVGHLPGSWSLIPLAVDYLVGILVAGRTLGMYLFGLRVVRVDQVAAVTPARALARTALLFLLVPALLSDRDGRGLHDRVSATAVVQG
ncbi:MAG: RDD family protein [Jatrophihabitantaceae bacterium]